MVWNFQVARVLSTSSFNLCVQFTNLQGGHDYFFRVFANNAAGLSDEPAEVKQDVAAQLFFGNCICCFE